MVLGREGRMGGRRCGWMREREGKGVRAVVREERRVVRRRRRRRVGWRECMDGLLGKDGRG